ncbi:hypothetical protein O181_096599 [Austropuccinia psidii MF-1]|uniref:Uncharacterized protein n=1 Tax=Austropuccinia psidii MF-1 TaxID=1389203 RepID=A0A9Q3J7L1_9BASI|nr:hypothetical protein [Austropuccinia psidii MF-1]
MKSVHSFTGRTPAMLEKGWNPRLPADTLRKDLIEIHPTASSFKLILDKVKQHAKQSMNEAFDYAKTEVGQDSQSTRLQSRGPSSSFSLKF